MIVLLAALFLSIGLVNFDFGPRWAGGQIRRLSIGFPLALAYAYFQMPPLVFPQAFSLLLLTLIPNAAYSLTMAARTIVFSRRIVSIRKTPARPYVIAVAVVGVFAGILVIAPIVDASGLRDIVAVTTSTALPPSADVKHVRVVPQEAAEFSGNKVIGQLGAYYTVGDFDVQVAAGRLVWVAPLEFHGIVQWLARRTSPGVIIVSAEDPNAAPELRQRAPLTYVPSALLNANLYRHVYMTYGTELILETTLQLDDKGDPQYLCTLGRPTIGWSGTRVTGVVVVNPATGAMRRVDSSNFGNLPKWVSRVYPVDLALDYNRWFGLYVHGIWNALIFKRDVHVPARPEVFGILAGARFVWFVDHTSPANDQSMTGFTYMDTVSGKMTYYTSSGGEFNSEGAEAAVASNPVVRQGKLYPTQPLLYNAFGENTWVVPLVAETGKFQNVTLVQATNGHVVVGSSASESPEADAFAQYAAFLRGAAPAANAATRAGLFAGTIDRIGAAPTGIVYFTLRGQRRTFALDSKDDPSALLVRSGDRVQFTSPDTAAPYVEARAFRDEAIAR